MCQVLNSPGYNICLQQQGEILPVLQCLLHHKKFQCGEHLGTRFYWRNNDITDFTLFIFSYINFFPPHQPFIPQVSSSLHGGVTTSDIGTESNFLFCCDAACICASVLLAAVLSQAQFLDIPWPLALMFITECPSLRHNIDVHGFIFRIFLHFPDPSLGQDLHLWPPSSFWEHFFLSETHLLAPNLLSGNQAHSSSSLHNVYA